MTKEFLCGIVIFYKQSMEQVSLALDNSRVLDGLIVVVNGEKDGIFDRLLGFKNISIIVLGDNYGIASATNRGIYRAKQEFNADYIAMLDQDTRLPKNFRQILDIRSELSISSKVGIVCPAYVNPRTRLFSKGLVFNKYFFKRFEPKGQPKLVSCPIASGSVIHISIFEAVGFFKDDFFIDYVDTEFCLRLCSLGYQNYLVPSIVMEHELGDQLLIKVMGVSFKPTNHAPVRKYYITRNRLYVIRKYYKLYYSLIVFEVLAVTLDVFRILVFEKDSTLKLKMMYRGLLDFLRGRYGALI
jgi:rhamnosyltransferase